MVRSTITDEASLPNFNDRQGYNKTLEITEDEIRSYQQNTREIVDLIQRKSQEKGGQVTVLDYGCGKGGLVAYLRSIGIDAYGADISSSYIEVGNSYFTEKFGDESILSIVDENSQTNFKENSFDIVLSVQVLEHVEDLELVAREISRVSRPEAFCLHVLPAKWRPVEVHLEMPFVHWFPKDSLRKHCIVLLMRLGVGVKYFDEYPIADRAEIYYRYSINQTFYRSVSNIKKCFKKYNFECETKAAVLDYLKLRLPAKSLPILRMPVVSTLIAYFYVNFWATRLYCYRSD